MARISVPIHFVDFEGSLSSGILEYGVVTLAGNAVQAVATRCCRPAGRIRAEDAAVHGLTAPALADCAPFADEFAWFAERRSAGPFAAHFAGAENSLIKSAWPYGRNAPDFARPGATTNEWGPWLDTGALYRELQPGLGDYGLERLVAARGLQAELDDLAARHCPAERRRYHAAPYDALGGALLLLDLLRHPLLADATLPWLLQMSTRDAGKRGSLQQGELL